MQIMPDPQVTAESDGFAKVPRWLFEAGVDGRALQVYVGLYLLAEDWRSGLPEVSGKSRRELADYCHCSQDTFDRGVRALIELGALETTEVTDRHGRRDPNRYHVVLQRVGRKSAGVSAAETGSVPYREDLQREMNPTGSSLTPSAKNDVDIVFNHWRTVRGKSSRMTLTPERRRKIEARLKTFTVDELKHAIEGVAFDPWEDRHLQDDITIIFRNDSQVEKFSVMRERPPQRGVKRDPNRFSPTETLRRLRAEQELPPGYIDERMNLDDTIDGELLSEEG